MQLDSVALRAVVVEAAPLLEGGLLQKISQLTEHDLALSFRRPGVTRRLLLRLVPEDARLGLVQGALPPARYWTLTGTDGQERIAQIMRSLRENPPEEVAGLKVLAVRDYLTGTRTEGGKPEPVDFPESNALYYELEGSAWTAIRPSGTEPKVKLYVGIREESEPAARALLDCCAKAALSLMER